MEPCQIWIALTVAIPQVFKLSQLMRAFEMLTAPLAGRSLVEASAGTGKTYALSTLLVRLLLEQGLTVDDPEGAQLLEQFNSFRPELPPASGAGIERGGPPTSSSPTTSCLATPAASC